MACDCVTEINRGFQQHNAHVRVLQDGFSGCYIPKLKVERIKSKGGLPPQPRLIYCPWCGMKYNGKVET